MAICYHIAAFIIFMLAIVLLGLLCAFVRFKLTGSAIRETDEENDVAWIVASIIGTAIIFGLMLYFGMGIAANSKTESLDLTHYSASLLATFVPSLIIVVMPSHQLYKVIYTLIVVILSIAASQVSEIIPSVSSLNIYLSGLSLSGALASCVTEWELSKRRKRKDKE